MKMSVRGGAGLLVVAPGSAAAAARFAGEIVLSRALRVKHETTQTSIRLISEGHWGPYLELGVAVKKRERVFR
jgi:hypothetical protein